MWEFVVLVLMFWALFLWIIALFAPKSEKISRCRCRWPWRCRW